MSASKSATKSATKPAVTKAAATKAAVTVISTKAATKASTATKAVTPRLNDKDKALDPENYIRNPKSEHYVLRKSPTGKKIIEAEENGEEYEMPLTESQRIERIVEVLNEELDLGDTEIKKALGKKEYASLLPRSFPKKWGGKQTEKKDKDAPKGPCNAYIFFTKEVRASTTTAMKLDNPKVTNKEIVAGMGQLWQETSPADREEYEAMAIEDKKRYDDEMEVYEAEHPDKARKSTKDANSPKRPTKMTAYHLFCEENRERLAEENEELDGREINALLAKKWEEFKKKQPKKFAKYQALADEANEDFEERLEEFNAEMEATGSPKKFTPAEQAKADQPDKYELNVKTGRHVLRKEAKAEAKPKANGKTTKMAAKKKKPVVEEEDDDEEPVEEKPAEDDDEEPEEEKPVEATDDDDDLLVKASA